MKLLAIIGSPRKGNTYRLVQKVEGIMRGSVNDMEIEYLFLKDEDLGLCRGCFVCISHGEERCPIKDGRAELVAKMSAADGIILATPSYAQNVTALMKNFIDRLSYLCHRPCFFDKQFLLVTTSCGGGLKETLEYVEKIVRSWGATSVRTLALMQHPSIPISVKTEQKIEKTAREFLTAVQTKESRPPRLTDIMQFRFMRFNSQEAKDHFPADNRFYDGKRDYYLPIRLNPIVNSLAKVLEKLLLRLMAMGA